MPLKMKACLDFTGNHDKSHAIHLFVCVLLAGCANSAESSTG